MVNGINGPCSLPSEDVFCWHGNPPLAGFPVGIPDVPNFSWRTAVDGSFPKPRTARHWKHSARAAMANRWAICSSSPSSFGRDKDRSWYMNDDAANPDYLRSAGQARVNRWWVSANQPMVNSQRVCESQSINERRPSSRRGLLDPPYLKNTDIMWARSCLSNTIYWRVKATCMCDANASLAADQVRTADPARATTPWPVRAPRTGHSRCYPARSFHRQRRRHRQSCQRRRRYLPGH